MKYYSEELKKTFDTEEECLQEERKYRLAKQEEAQKQNDTKRRKKEFSKQIEDSRAKLEEAVEKYNAIKLKAADILEEACKKVRDMMKDSDAEIEKAKVALYNAVKKFNDEFGAYQTPYDYKKLLLKSSKTEFPIFDAPSFDFFDKLFKDLF